jgi:hypothetical protein
MAVSLRAGVNCANEVDVVVGSVGGEIKTAGLNKLLKSGKLEIGLVLVDSGIMLIEIPSPAVKVGILESLVSED